MNTKTENDNESDFESIVNLLMAIRYDPVINKKVVNILKMDSYPRRIVLSNWLEQLHRSNAPDKLTQTLTYLFDDTIADKVYGLVNKSNNDKNNPDI